MEHGFLNASLDNHLVMPNEYGLLLGR